MDTSKISAVDAAYTAGIIDGEGCIRIARRAHTNGRAYHQLVVAVANTDRALLEWLAATWGQPAILDQPTSSPRDKDQWSVRWYGGTAIGLIEAIAPYLRVKARQAAIAVEFQSTVHQRGSQHPIADVVFQHREGLWQAISRLNRKGRAA